MKRSELTVEYFKENFVITKGTATAEAIVEEILEGTEVVLDCELFNTDWKGARLWFRRYKTYLHSDKNVNKRIFKGNKEVYFQDREHYKMTGTIRQRCLSEWS